LKSPELGDIRNGEPSRTDALEKAVYAIGTEISLLHQLSNTIRKASRETQNLKAATLYEMKDQEGKDLDDEFKDQFAAELLRRKFPAASEEIRSRLASAMLLRRKRVLYRRSRYMKAPIKTSSHAPQLKEHPGPLEAQRGSEIFNPAINQPLGSQVVSTERPASSFVASQAQTATVVDPTQFRKAATPSIVSDGKTVALGDHEELSFPPAPQGYMVQRFSWLKERRLNAHEAELDLLPNYRLYRDYNGHPPLPQAEIQQLEYKINEAEEALKLSLEEDWDISRNVDVDVMCPYCCCVLPSSELGNEWKWK
jgi:hypothetical protein